MHFQSVCNKNCSRSPSSLLSQTSVLLSVPAVYDVLCVLSVCRPRFCPLLVCALSLFSALSCPCLVFVLHVVFVAGPREHLSRESALGACATNTTSRTKTRHGQHTEKTDKSEVRRSQDPRRHVWERTGRLTDQAIRPRTHDANKPQHMPDIHQQIAHFKPTSGKHLSRTFHQHTHGWSPCLSMACPGC